MLITQHMPAGFTKSFAQRLNAMCAVTVQEAVHGERVLPGHVYLAPGGETHMRLGRSGANYVIELFAGDPVNRHRPSVDVLFDSAAYVYGPRLMGIVLTGMGEDGLQGARAIAAAGGCIFAQALTTCVVDSMPAAALVPAILLGVPLGIIAGFYGGLIDNLIMRIMDIILAFPSLLLALVLVAILGPGLENAMLAIAIVALIGVVVAGRTSELTALGGWIWLSARVVYLPLYGFGVPVVRTIIFMASLVGLLIALWPLLGF